MKIGVIIGRFQLTAPHIGHRVLYRMVSNRCDKVIVLIGESTVKFTDRNPLPYENRSKILRTVFPDAYIAKIEDHEEDEVWSKNVDEFIKSLIVPGDTVTLFGSRDSFIDSYTGVFKTIELNQEESASSTELRKVIGNKNLCSPMFNTGIIYAVENRFPIVYSTVDIAVIKYDKDWDREKIEILLAKKKGKTKWCLIGGFVDKKDKNLVDAAYRELHEEVIGLEHHELTYVGSHSIDDFRYRGTKDGIMTNLFKTFYMGGNVQPGDDLAGGELKFFKLHEASEYVVPAHLPLIQLILNHNKYS